MPREKEAHGAAMWLSQLARMLTAFLSNTNHFIEVLSEETAQCAFSLAMLPPAIVNLVYVERLCHGVRHMCSRLQSEGLLCLGPLSVRQTAPIWTHRTSPMVTVRMPACINLTQNRAPSVNPCSAAVCDLTRRVCPSTQSNTQSHRRPRG